MRPALAQLASRQYGVWTYRQAVECGYTPSQIRARHAARKWARIRRGAYCDGRRVPDPRARGVALTLTATTPVILSHDTAAAFHGFDLRGGQDVHVTIPAQRWHGGLRQAGTVRHCADSDRRDVVSIGPTVCTSPVRTVLDLACTLPGQDALAAADRALRVGAVEASQLHHLAAQRLRGRDGAESARVVAAWADGRSESAPESHLRWEFIRSPLPVPEPQTVVRVSGRGYRPDLGYRFAAVGAEYDSDEHHAGGRERRHDRDRDAALRAAGWLLEYVTPYELYRIPHEPLARIANALEARGFEPRRLRRRQTPGDYLH